MIQVNLFCHCCVVHGMGLARDTPTHFRAITGSTSLPDNSLHFGTNAKTREDVHFRTVGAVLVFICFHPQAW